MRNDVHLNMLEMSIMLIPVFFITWIVFQYRGILELGKLIAANIHMVSISYTVICEGVSTN